ncbi:hypothetical protein [Microbacterium gilvum]|uniref:Di-and tripeptidase n=1 Tax=Microbacterium gilvum TaxID=1336204 RepID=A0ABP8ZR41_9MICO
MAERVPRIHSLPDDAPWQGGLPPAGSEEHPFAIRALDRVLSIQRPAVLAHLRSMRLRHPEATPPELVRMLERRYLLGVTTGGAAVGAAAVVPGVGTGITLAISGVETIGFVEATALYAQSLAEVHGFAVDDPNRSRALVMTLMLGKEGVDLVRNLASQVVGKGTSLSTHWGDLITKTLPRAAVGPLVDRLKAAFLHQFAVRGGTSVVGKALPFGVGAAVGGVGNHVLGRRVVVASRKAFGTAPGTWPSWLEPKPGAETMERSALRGVRMAGASLRTAAGSMGAGVGAIARGVSRRRPGTPRIEASPGARAAADSAAEAAPEEGPTRP